MMMRETVKTENMIAYLQSMMDRFQRDLEKYGPDDRVVDGMFHKMIACKEMVEVMIGLPVNLQKDGKVTVGF